MQDALRNMYGMTARALRGDEMEFEPFLPDDDRSLASRVEALAQWCQGFLYGFGAVRSGSELPLSHDVDEVLRDVANIARAGVGDADPTEEDEVDYADIVEYIRAGVQLVYDELQGNQPKKPHVH